MKYILAAAALLALLGSAEAQTAKLSAPYVGAWCATAQSNIYARCRDADGEDALQIHARHFFAGETRCVPLAIVPERDGHFVQASCRLLEEGSKVERVLQRWRLTDGGRRLQVRAADSISRRDRGGPSQ
jgi:hypothetical protein